METSFATINKIYDTLIDTHKGNIEDIQELSKGIIPEGLRDEYNQLILESEPVEATGYDEYLYDNAFRASQYSKFISQKKGTSIQFPIITSMSPGKTFQDLYNEVIANTIKDPKILKDNLN